jgi:hypothetical protein
VSTELPDPRAEPTVSVERAGSILGLGRSKSYIEARRYIGTDGREGLPAIAFGRALRVPTARLLALLGIDANGATSTGNGAAHDESPKARE